MTTPCVLIMAGGTGGHVFPALALARALREHALDVVWLGTHRGIEARIVPAAGFPVAWINVGGVRGKGLVTRLAAPLTIARAIAQSLGVMRRYRPAVVVGLGGFVTGPGGIAAWITRRPLVVHEQNAIAGFTNRILARFARRVLEAFAGSFGANVRATDIGNPVRAEFFAQPAPEQRFAGRTGPVRLLVVGGSQGAARLNAVVPEALALLDGTLAFEVRHQTGERGVEAARAAYAKARVTAELLPFIDDLAAQYGWADLVVCRSGALTVSELAAVGVGSILVPFPAAVDDHQTRNAQYLTSHGAAELLPEKAMTAQTLAQRLLERAMARGALLEMARKAHALARPAATRELAEACLAAGRLA